MNKSLWARYQEEVTETRFVEHDYGFFCYALYEDVLYIEHIYVAPEERGKGRFKEMIAEAKELAKLAGKKKVVGFVTLLNKLAAEALKCHLSIGAEPYQSHDGKIWLRIGVD